MHQGSRCKKAQKDPTAFASAPGRGSCVRGAGRRRRSGRSLARGRWLSGCGHGVQRQLHGSSALVGCGPAKPPVLSALGLSKGGCPLEGRKNTELCMPAGRGLLSLLRGGFAATHNAQGEGGNACPPHRQCLQGLRLPALRLQRPGSGGTEQARACHYCCLRFRRHRLLLK